MNTYLNNSACVTCDCAVCINSTRCVKCTSSKPYLYPFNSSCVTACPDRYYPDNNTMMCQLCPSLCQVCTSHLNCQRCMASPLSYYIFLYKGVCYSLCPNGTFGDEQSGKCLLCSPNCLRCYGNQPKQCISCQPGYIMNINECVQKCPLYKFLDSKYQCEKCYPLCERCFGPASFQCLTCAPDWHLYDHSCHLTCPIGTFQNHDENGNLICTRCSEGCTECNDANSCTTCRSSYVIYNTKCLPSCPQGYFLNQSTNLCTVCPSGCQ